MNFLIILNYLMIKKLFLSSAILEKHKNHKYIIDAAEILKNNNDKRFFCILWWK